MINIKNLFITTSFILFSNLHLIGQPGGMPMAQEPGNCYAKCLIPAKYEAIEETFAIYTGDFDKAIELDSMYFRIDENSNELIYLGYKNNLEHFQLDDIDSFEKIVFLVNPENLEHYVEETVVYQKLEKEEVKEWREVVCGHKVGGSIMAQLQDALIREGYLDRAKSTTTLTIDLKAALTNYQKENGLPIGQLDIETLESLEIWI